MKRPTETSLAGVLSKLLAERLAISLGNDFDLIVPIPMHWLRRSLRGVNSPDVIAQAMAPQLNAKFLRALARRRNTAPQASLSLTARRENMKAAFRVRRPRGIQGRRIVLIDDVMTTCSTCHEAARALLSAGASEVVAAVVARATPH